LVPLWNERERCLRDLRIFGREHGLAREARYPASRLLHVGVIAILIILESSANAFYFAELSAFGLLGGFALALGISLINVASAFAVGRFLLPYITYRNRRGRILTATALTLLGSAAILFNLALARYRDILAVGDPSDVGLLDLLRGSSTLTLPSLALFGTGLLAWSIALWKGASFDDLYPGFGSADRRFREADRAYTAARDALVGRALDHIHSIPAVCRSILDKAAGTLVQLDETIVEVHRVLESYETQRQDEHAGCRVYLRMWRDENTFVRTDQTPPYFEEYPQFPTLVSDGLVNALAGRAELARKSVQSLESDAHRINMENTERLSAAAERARSRIEETLQRSASNGSAAPNGEMATAKGRAQ
jgi:hypothetical protein